MTNLEWIAKGNIALDYVVDFASNENWGTKKILHTIHPSFRNRALFKKTATSLLKKIESFINN